MILSCRSANSSLPLTNEGADTPVAKVVSPQSSCVSNFDFDIEYETFEPVGGADPAKGVYLLILGMSHLPMMVSNLSQKIADSEKAKVVVITAGGVGKTQKKDGGAFYPTELADTALAVVEREVKRGQSLTIVMHSYGAATFRPSPDEIETAKTRASEMSDEELRNNASDLDALEEFLKRRGIDLAKVTYAAPIISGEDEELAGVFSPSFVLPLAGELFFETATFQDVQLSLNTETAKELYFNCHPESAVQEKFAKMTERSPLNMNLLAMSAVLAFANRRPLIKRAATDPKVEIIFFDDHKNQGRGECSDNIIELLNRDITSGIPGIKSIRGGHSCFVNGGKCTDDVANAIRAITNGKKLDVDHAHSLSGNDRKRAFTSAGVSFGDGELPLYKLSIAHEMKYPLVWIYNTQLSTSFKLGGSVIANDKEVGVAVGPVGLSLQLDIPNLDLFFSDNYSIPVALIAEGVFMAGGLYDSRSGKFEGRGEAGARLAAMFEPVSGIRVFAGWTPAKCGGLESKRGTECRLTPLSFDAALQVDIAEWN